MRSVARFVGVLVMIIGAVVLITPGQLFAFGDSILTPAGLYVIAALRIGIGLLLFGAARESRAPSVLRIVGLIIVVAGIATPFFGAERSRLVLDWLEAQGPMVVRLPGVVLLALGGGLTYLTGAGRRA